MKTNIIGLKELREKTKEYLARIGAGQSFIVVRKSHPLFKISPIDEAEDLWEEVVDFTKLKKGGISFSDILARL